MELALGWEEDLQDRELCYQEARRRHVTPSHELAFNLVFVISVAQVL